MPVPLRMPKFEMSQEEGTVVNWLRPEGAWVEKGEPVLEVETDKVVMEVEAPASGYLCDVTAPVGKRVPVTTVIAAIWQKEEEGFATASGASSGPLPDRALAADLTGGEGDAPLPAGGALGSAVPPADAGQAAHRQADHRWESPLAKKLAGAAGIDIQQVPGSGPGGRVTRLDVEQFLAGHAADAVGARPSGGRPRATPAARRIAREQGVDLSEVEGSGPRSRVQEHDVLVYLESVAASVVAQAVSAPVAGLSAAAQPEARSPIAVDNAGLAREAAQPAASDGIETMPLQGMRRTIAERMQHSYQTAPHVTFTVEVDMTEANALRSSLNQKAEKLGIPHLSVTGILVKVCAWALLRHPWMNAALIGETIYRYPSPNVGVAVALKDGLIVPVIQQASRLSLSEIAQRLQDLTERSSQGRLTPQDVAGGTFTISNLGMFGVDQFTAILNPPQCAILAVGRTVKQARVIESPDGDRVEIRPVMKMTLSADHRIVDGAIAARFLQDVTAALEDPRLLLV